MKHKARKRFGQNFLQDSAIIDQIIACINPQGQDHIVEIGPGQGALTRQLLANCNKFDAIELDRDLIPLLKINLASFSQKLNILNQDALKLNFCSLVKEPETFRLVGNLPYNISSPLLFHFIQHRHCISDMHFMLQKEVVDRICAVPSTKAYGRLSVMLQYFCRVEKLFEVPPHAFNPPPKVDSAIVRLIPYNSKSNPYDHTLEDEKSLEFICQQAFAQRRKTLRNNLKKILSAEQIESLEIDPGARAETLTINQFIQLANLYK